MAGLGGREVEVAVGLERLAELVAAGSLPARRAGDEREVLVGGGLVVKGRQAERQRGLEFPCRAPVVGVFVAFHAALEVLLGAAFLACRGGRLARRGGPQLRRRRGGGRGRTLLRRRARGRRGFLRGGRCARRAQQRQCNGDRSAVLGGRVDRHSNLCLIRTLPFARSSTVWRCGGKAVLRISIVCLPGGSRSSLSGGVMPVLRPSMYTSPHGVTAKPRRASATGFAAGAAAGAGVATTAAGAPAPLASAGNSPVAGAAEAGGVSGCRSWVATAATGTGRGAFPEAIAPAATASSSAAGTPKRTNGLRHPRRSGAGSPPDAAVTRYSAPSSAARSISAVESPCCAAVGRFFAAAAPKASRGPTSASWRRSADISRALW